MSLIVLLAAVLVICVLFWAAQRLMAAFSVPDPIRTVVLVVLVLIALVWFLGVVGLGPTRLGLH